MKYIPLSNRKYSTLRYLTHELKSTVGLLEGTQTFIQKYKIVFLEKKKKNNVLLKCYPKWYFKLKIIFSKQIFLEPDRGSYPSTFI